MGIHFRKLPVSTLCLCLGVAGCAHSVGADPAAVALTDGTPDAVGVLAFLNSLEATRQVLDEQVPLDRRAADNLVAHRDGEDETPGTADDDPFDTVAEVDDVSWVGPSALDRLAEYAASAGWVPQADDVLGVYDGVSFTVVEAERTVAFVNEVSLEQLDDELGLDVRAADSISEAQPIGSVMQLASLYYVGRSALERIKAAATATPTVEFEDQFNHDEAVEIPDNSPVGVSTRVRVSSTVPAVPLSVDFVLDVLHDAPEEIELELTSPSGEVWRMTLEESAHRQSLGTLADPRGEWTLVAVDGSPGNVGELYGWALEVRTP